MTFPTPPSTAGFLSHQHKSVGGGEDGVKSEQQTPASESERRDGDGDAEMVNGGGESGEVAAAVNEVSMTDTVAATDAEHRRTDHERQSPSSHNNTVIDMSPPPLAPRLYKLRTESKSTLRISHCVSVY